MIGLITLVISSSRVFADTSQSIHLNVSQERLKEGKDQWKKGELEKALKSLEEAAKLDSPNKKTPKVL